MKQDEIAVLAEKVALSVNGVFELGAKRGVRVASEGENGYVLDVYLVVRFGTKIPEAAWNVQKKIAAELKERGVKFKAINIHIRGVKIR